MHTRVVNRNRPTICMLTAAPMLFDGRIQREAKSLRDAGYSVRIVYVEDPRFLQGVPNLEEAWRSYHREMEGIVTERVFLRSREWLWLPKPARLLLQALELFAKFTAVALTRRADVFHCHDLIPGIFCVFARWAQSARVVYDAHELEAYSENRWIRRMQALYERFVVRNSEAVITVNDEIAEAMEQAYGKPPAVVQNRPNLVHSAELDRGRLRAALGVDPSTVVVLYVGWVTPRERGIEQMVEALSYLPDRVVFAIVGVGRLDEFKEYLRGIMESHRVRADRVRFVGPYPPDEVVHYVAGADVSIALYQRSVSVINAVNTPNKLFQSIMARTPILASDNETLPQYVRHAAEGPVGEVVDEAQPRLIAEKILEMVKPESQELYRRNAESFARRISWEWEAARLLEVYAQVLGSRPAEVPAAAAGAEVRRAG